MIKIPLDDFVSGDTNDYRIITPDVVKFRAESKQTLKRAAQNLGDSQ